MATYFISNSPTGDDSNSGLSELLPWETVSKVNGISFAAGDTILFNKGNIWREQLTVPTSGSAGSPITFSSYGTGDAPIISALDVISGNWVQNGTEWEDDSIDTEVKVLVVDEVLWTEGTAGALNADEWDWTSANGGTLFIFGNPAGKTVLAAQRNTALLFDGKDYVTFQNIELQGSNAGGFGNVRVANSSNIILRECESKWGRYGVYFADSNGGSNSFIGLTLHDNTFFGFNVDGDTGSGSGTESKLQNSTVYNNVRNGVEINGNYWIVENCVIYDNGNTSDEFNALHLFTTASDSGAGNNNILRYNIVYNQVGGGNDGAGIAVDQWCDDNQIYYNICYNNDGPGFYNFGATGNKFHNNTSYKNCQDSSGELSIPGEFRMTGTRTDNIEWKNNIAWAKTGVYATYLTSDTFDSTFVITNNLWTADDTNWFFFNVSAGSSLATWNGFTGVGTDINADPRFVDAANTDFRLLGNSPCIGAGTDVSLLHDFAGRKVHQSIDIGAFVFIGAGRYNGGSRNHRRSRYE